jgi:hypothetical protein
MKNLYRGFLIAEILVIFAVSVIFKLVPDKLVAGAVAGTIFVLIGIWIVTSGFRNSFVRKSPTFVLGCVHLFVVALPMMITRLMNYAAKFEDVRILGMPGPMFHHLSTVVYFLMMIATAFDWWRAWRLDKAAATNTSS